MEIRAEDVHEAVEIAEELKRAERYDWFRGQIATWRVRSSLARRYVDGRAKAAFTARGTLREPEVLRLRGARPAKSRSQESRGARGSSRRARPKTGGDS